MLQDGNRTRIDVDLLKTLKHTIYEIAIVCERLPKLELAQLGIVTDHISKRTADVSAYKQCHNCNSDAGGIDKHRDIFVNRLVDLCPA